MQEAEFWGILYGFGGFFIGIVISYIMTAWANPFSKARLKKLIWRKTFCVGLVETDNMEIHSQVFPIDSPTITIKGMEHDFVIDRNMFRRMLDIPTIGFHFSNRTPTHYRPVDVDYHHVLVPAVFNIPVPEIPVRVPQGFDKKGEPIFKDMVIPAKSIQIRADQVFNGVELTDSPYPNLKEIKELAKIITYKATASPKTFSAYLKATDVEAEIRASQQRNKLIESMKQLLTIAVIAVGISLAITGYVAVQQNSQTGTINQIQSSVSILNQTIQNATIRVLVPMNMS
jgi:hypothetical protein